jgi:hypothetical protein
MSNTEILSALNVSVSLCPEPSFFMVKTLRFKQLRIITYKVLYVIGKLKTIAFLVLVLPQKRLSFCPQIGLEFLSLLTVFS